MCRRDCMEWDPEEIEEIELTPPINEGVNENMGMCPGQDFKVYVNGYVCIPTHGRRNPCCNPCNRCCRRRYIRRRFCGEVRLF